MWGCEAIKSENIILYIYINVLRSENQFSADEIFCRFFIILFYEWNERNGEIVIRVALEFAKKNIKKVSKFGPKKSN